ncbi:MULTISPECIES: hypothetical protein [Polaromonas]|uniref:Lipoprotein n=1 Tax=Polaromonas aquatica TaxID=332657 RepID=A0ABW1TRA7_9BURK
MKLLAALACMALSACSANPFTDDATARQVNVGGRAYLISQLTAGTWTATASNPLTPLPDDTASRAALLRAIEKISDCKVTDSDYSRQGMQLDAQVDCGGGLNN